MSFEEHAKRMAEMQLEFEEMRRERMVQRQRLDQLLAATERLIKKVGLNPGTTPSS